MWMDSGSHAGRASAAFAAIGLIIVTLGINISANSISAANDLMAFCPKYINIRRGQLLAAVIGSWAFVPVSCPVLIRDYVASLTTTAVENSRFGSDVPCFPWWLYHFLGSDDIYSHDRVSHSSARYMVPADGFHSYFIVRRGNVSVPDMYWFHGIYRYSPKFATNWRAVAAFFIGCAPPLPGFINNIVVAGGSTINISTGGQHL
jgi:NCS1 family nucleobase:cation symporter-1